MTRTFIALELDGSQRRYSGEIIRWMAQELPDLRWVDPAGIHLTLAFLGELNDERLAEAMRAATCAAQVSPPFECRFSRPGIFGSLGHPRVIWIGVEESSGHLQLLHKQLNLELVQRGFAVDTRPFSPHLTLARIKSPLNQEEQHRLQRLLTVAQHQHLSPTIHVSQISVMKSELSQTRASYSCLLVSALAG